MMMKALNKAGLATKKAIDFLAGTTKARGYLSKAKLSMKAGLAGHRIDNAIKEKDITTSELRNMDDESFAALCRQYDL